MDVVVNKRRIRTAVMPANACCSRMQKQELLFSYSRITARQALAALKVRPALKIKGLAA